MMEKEEKRNIYIVANFGEMFLKGQNIRFFERKLLSNVLDQLREWEKKIIFEKKSGGAFFMKLDKTISEDEILRIEDIIKNTPGFATYYRAYFCKTDMSEIKTLAVDVALEYVQKYKNIQSITTFGINTKKSDTGGVSLKSADINTESGSAVYKALAAVGFQLSVNLDNPDLKIYIKTKKEKTFIFTEKKKAVGGLPVGSIGNAIALFSGGIDSPVAAFLAMKRGLHITAVHFHSVPKTSPESIEKVKELLQELSKFQKNIRLYSIPIIPVQKNIVANADRKLSIILQRRAFLKIGQKISEIEQEKYGNTIRSFVTGDCLGQVASQTVENMAVTSEVLEGTGNIIFRPLLTYDKKEIMDVARNIGTLAISEQPHEDACSLFVPKKPETKAKMEHTKNEERKLDESILDEVVSQTEIFEI